MFTPFCARHTERSFFLAKLSTRVWLEIALCAAIATVLDLFIPSPTFAVEVSVKMLPIIFLSLRRGWPAGMLGGFLWGLLQVLLGDAYFLSIIQFLLEYFVAFALVGLAGLLVQPMQTTLVDQSQAYGNQISLAIAALVTGSLARYLIHFLAGVWFWGSYAPEGQSPYLYSFLVNGGAFLSETLTCAIVIALLVKFYPRLILVKNQGKSWT